MAQNGLPDRTEQNAVSVIYGFDREIAHYVGEGLGEVFTLHDKALGFARGGKIIGGIVYHNYRDQSIEASIYTTDKHWANRNTLFHIFHYPFGQLNCRRFTAITRSRNQPARAFLKKLGFKKEGVIRHAFNDDDGILYGMLREECKWVNHRTPQTPPTRS